MSNDTDQDATGGNHDDESGERFNRHRLRPFMVISPCKTADDAAIVRVMVAAMIKIARIKTTIAILAIAFASLTIDGIITVYRSSFGQSMAFPVPR